MIDFEKVLEAKKQIKFSSEDLLRLGVMAKMFRKRASEQIGIEDEIFALALDLACQEQVSEYEWEKELQEMKAKAKIYAEVLRDFFNSPQFKNIVVNAVIENINQRGELYNLISQIDRDLIN